MHVPLWFVLMPAIVFLIDVCILLIVASRLLREIRRAVGKLESTAHEAVASAAKDVQDQIVKLLPQRPSVPDEAYDAIGGLFATLGVDPTPLREMRDRVRSRSVRSHSG